MISEDEYAAAREYLPPVVYLPVRELSGEDGPTVEMRELEDGRLALLAYTALDRLARCQGKYQPWILLPTSKLEQLRHEVNYQVIYLDVPIPQEQRRKANHG